MLKPFQQYQQTFTQHIRDPKACARPKHVPAQRMSVYSEIVFNNMQDTLAACFPVAKNVLGVRRWQKLVRGFLAEYRSQTPIFREIPQQFLQYLQAINANAALPPFLQDLMHYEWAELHLSALDVQTPALSPMPDLDKEYPVLNPAHLLLEYTWPVHVISKRYQPTTSERTHILMFRNAAYEVKFVLLNVMTYQLLTLMKQREMSGEQMLREIAVQIHHPQPEQIVMFGLDVLRDLQQQGAVIGTRKLPQ